MEKNTESLNKIKLLTKKIYDSRLRMITNHPFFGMLSLNLKYSLNTKIDTFTTNGKTISFNPDFLDLLDSEEVDFCILHCLMHIALKHPLKAKNYKNKELYNLACDIVVNSNILYSLDLINQKEIIIQGIKMPHLTLDNKEGYLFSVDEIYEDLLKHLISDEENDLKPIIKFNSNYKGTLYFKNESFMYYRKDGTWYNDPYEKEIYKDESNLFIYDKLIQLDKVYNIKITSLTNSNLLPAICYSLITKEKNYPLKSYNSTFTFSKINLNKIKELNSISFKDKEISKIELKYQKYVEASYLTVPSDVRKYFESIIKIKKFDKNDEDIIFKVRNYIRKCAKYDLKYFNCPSNKDFILKFLETRLGVCRHFASAAVMLYRTLGIPSRYVIGFKGNSKENEVCSLTDMDRHAFVEVYVNNVGWVIVEPTGAVSGNGSDENDGDDDENDQNSSSSLDSHTNWNDVDKFQEKEIEKMLVDAQELSKNLGRGKVPNSIEVLIKELLNPQIDWRVYLNNFLNEVVVDYSFMIPDKRFSDSSFILPSFSELDEEVKDILFMVDVSGSMSDECIVKCFNEIISSIQQFNGKLKGYVGFFDDVVKKVVPFEEEEDILKIRPYGRGGTNFHNVFKYIKEEMSNKLPVSIIILTDGEARFPDLDATLGIPVLWVINNEFVNPPWGDVVRIK